MYIDGNYHNIDLIKDAPKERWREFKSGDLWGGKDCHGWFKCSVEVPNNFEGKVIVLTFILLMKDGMLQILNLSYMLMEKKFKG